jgi:hypothetical protein
MKNIPFLGSSYISKHGVSGWTLKVMRLLIVFVEVLSRFYPTEVVDQLGGRWISQSDASICILQFLPPRILRQVAM